MIQKESKNNCYNDFLSEIRDGWVFYNPDRFQANLRRVIEVGAITESERMELLGEYSRVERKFLTRESNEGNKLAV